MANTNTTNHGVHPSNDDRPSKRPRLSSPSDATCGLSIAAPAESELASESLLPSLVPEVWATVMDFLPYDSVLQSAAVSRSMLHEVMPLVTMLHIDRSSQLHTGVVSRYRDIRDIYIYSLLSCDNSNGRPRFGIHECLVDEDTATRAVPFLCNNNFIHLERVFFGGRDYFFSGRGEEEAWGFIPGFIPLNPFVSEDDEERMDALINALSGAFRSGALGNNVWILGLRCPKSSRSSSIVFPCRVCENACKSFPLESVVDFECRGSSHTLDAGSNYYSEQLYSLDVCLSRKKIEGIVKKRLGGLEVLYSQARFFSLLGRGTRKIVVSSEGKELYVVKYEKDELKAIKQFIKDARMDVGKLSPHAVTDAIRRSFTEDERDVVPPQRDQCYLAGSSFRELRALGLPIDEADFLNADEWDGQKHRSIHPVSLYSVYDWRFT